MPKENRQPSLHSIVLRDCGEVFLDPRLPIVLPNKLVVRRIPVIGSPVNPHSTDGIEKLD